MSEDRTWVDATQLCVEGRGFADTWGPFGRLPACARDRLREPVWDLAKHPTGVTVTFETDAVDVRARWHLGGAPTALPHTPLLAAYGIDLYGQADDGTWRWVGVTRELAGQEAESAFVGSPLDGRLRRYRAYLPVFSPVDAVAFGVPAAATIRAVAPRAERPVAYYGTSIVHGVGASRAGMTHVALLGRRLNYPVLNLGLSGNAVMEPEMAEVLAELDPVAYVLDPVPNMSGELIDERGEAFVQRLREAHPTTPIILVEDRTYPAGWACPAPAADNLRRRAAYQRLCAKLVAAGVESLHYIEGDGLLGWDGDGTNDGSHCNDLGASHMADSLVPVLRRVIYGL